MSSNHPVRIANCPTYKFMSFLHYAISGSVECVEGIRFVDVPHRRITNFQKVIQQAHNNINKNVLKLCYCTFQ